MTSEAQPGQEQRMVTDERVKPHVPHWNGYGKYSPCISFDTGSLTIYGGGFDAKDGDGYFCFNDDDLEFEQDDGPVYRSINVANSDLLHLRDQLNKLFPTRPTADLGGDGELVERLRSPMFDNAGVLGAAAHEAADRLILYREALEAITREDGKNSRGFIDWQRCVDRIQAVARAVLSSDRKVAGDGGTA